MVYCKSNQQLLKSLGASSHLTDMQKKGEYFWCVGKMLTRRSWMTGEFVSSPVFRITDNCSLRIRFYPAGVGDQDCPAFERIRTNSKCTLKIHGQFQLCYGETLTKFYRFSETYEDGQSNCVYYLDDVENLSRFQIYHSLPDLCLRFIYTVTSI
ncbi:hypothetical protein HNY73_012098 [Argiope bruennichi]|uniref:Uncharacterized protein n=1 Tax=Argiope bruennichi TaxID=94029 RepID=A0A8T0EYB3_ARGBR|nr:hypothetical protein HNY73_012098 [Argiope bruennichi]